MAELCDIYDINGHKTGEVFMRGETLKEGQYYLAANIWIINSNFEILIQKRSELKNFSPNIWATHGGCVSAGETSLNGCIREVYEEIGIEIPAKDIKPLTRTTSGKLIMDNYIVVQEFNISSAKLQVEEVSEIKWVSLDELVHMAKNKEFFECPELPYVINFIDNYKSNIISGGNV
ncbi:NUDIX hydrolase [Oceanirhabdus seepicola]|uniref:NUDIX domain-containing protein n=1 Tax=Oceanirhabdus seepicola TaxID=2828781 RepID=A0A9J6NWU3_9CLOT|nr:NUDIX domain-containing protein [Oceanirhabdus seepicola]MCM1988922.1 NUDIX domain-containing protein [Oceanirhabdus seepicola]